MAKKKNVVSLTLLGTVPALSLQAQGGAQAVNLGLQQGLFKGVGQLKNFLKISNTKSFILKTLSVVGAVTICWLLFVLDKEVANKKLINMKSKEQKIVADLQNKIGTEILEKMKELYESCERYVRNIKLRDYYINSKRRLEYEMFDFLSKNGKTLRKYVKPLDEESLQNMVNNYDPEKNKSTLIESVIPYALYFLDMKKDERAINELDVEIKNFEDYVMNNDLSVMIATLKKSFEVKSSVKDKVGTTPSASKILKAQREGDITTIHKFLKGILNFLEKEITTESINGLVDSIGNNEITDHIRDINSEINKIEKNLNKTHFFPGQYTLFS